MPPSELCRVHLLGEHRELHAIWTILTQDKTGYRNHPETKRWEGKTNALFERHEALVGEMECRGYNHRSPIDRSLGVGPKKQDDLVDSIAKQRQLLRAKDCECPQ